MDLPLFQALQSLLDDPLFHYIQNKENFTEKLNEQRRWRQYVYKLSKYPTSVIKQVMEEHAKDMSLHQDLLKGLRDERNEKRFGGKRFYLRALNCIFFDSFKRCHVPFPPQPKWDIQVAIGVERKYIYMKQLRAWDAYKRRVFEILKVVIDNPTDDEGSVKVDGVISLKHRGEMVPMKKLCENEEKCIPFVEVRISTQEIMDEQRGKTVHDRPACACEECGRGFRAVVKRVLNARDDWLLYGDVRA